MRRSPYPVSELTAEDMPIMLNLWKAWQTSPVAVKHFIADLIATEGNPTVTDIMTDIGKNVIIPFPVLPTANAKEGEI